MAETRGGSVRSEAARQAILAATRLVLAEQGFDGLTIERVAAEASVGKQTIYRWWASKSALVAECIADAASGAALEVPVPDTGDLQADLETWLTQLSAYASEPQAAALLRGLVSAAAESPLVAERMYSQITEGAEAALTGRLSSDRDGEVTASRSASIALLGSFIYSILINRPLDKPTIHELTVLIARGIGGAAK